VKVNAIKEAPAETARASFVYISILATIDQASL
jgi:hypothetical protein